jgi:hypothetical protein
LSSKVFQQSHFGNSRDLRGTRTPSDHYFSMSERVTACRRKAGECELAARMATDPDARIMFRELAQMWLEMASELEHFEAAKRAAVIPSE